jgi:hypothetical protein
VKTINITALRRAGQFLNGLDTSSQCNEMKTLRALIEQAQADIGNGQTAMLPVQRSYDVRTKQLLAFNESRQAGKDVDEALEAAHLAMLRNSSSTVEAPAAGLYAIRHLDNWDGEGDIRVCLAAYDVKGVWRHDENGAPVLEYRGDKILQAWPLTDTPAPALTYDAGLEAAAAHILERIEQYRLDHGTHGDNGLELAIADRNHVDELQRLWESTRQLASTDPVPSTPIVNLSVECKQP